MAPQQSVRDALMLMKAASRNGEIRKARVIGDSCSIPLSLTKQQVKLGSKMGGGSEGTVYQGTYENKQVAVKQAKIGTSNDLDRFREELSILSEIRHPNVVPVLGASAMPPNFFTVMPRYDTKLEDKVYSKSWLGDWDDILKISYQLACALESVHLRGYLHRDVKPSNVMLDKKGNAVLIDFGLAAEVERVQNEFESRKLFNPSGGFHKQLMVGTMQYMAPELLLKQPHSFASDVYAWAITVNEMATKTFPYSDCTTDNPKAHTILDAGYTASELTAAVAGQNLRPTLPTGAPGWYEKLMQACWQADASLRPSMTTVKQIIDDVKLEMFSVPYMGQSVNYGGASTLVHSESMSSFESCSTFIASCSPPPAEGAVIAEFMGLIQVEQNSKEDTHAHKAHCEEIKHVQDVNMDYLPTITIGSFATAGRRDYMEDRHVVQEGGGDSPSSEASADYTLLSVFDGHRGSSAADFCFKNVDRYLKSAYKFQDSAMHALTALFMQLDEEYGEQMEELACQKGQGAVQYAGCTALVSVLQRNQLYVANAGDCRLVLCKKGKGVQITSDHTANEKKERQRVESQGGLVRWMVDGYRVGHSGMQVTRSIGDHDMKREGVIPTPEVHHLFLDEDDDFVIIASDGVWDKLDNQEAVGLVHDTVKHPAMCAKRIALEALQRGSKDNITVIVVFLKPVDTLEQTYSQGKHKYKFTPTAYGSRSQMQSSQCSARDEMFETY